MVGWRDDHLDGFRMNANFCAFSIGDNVPLEGVHDHASQGDENCDYYPYRTKSSCHSSILTLMLIFEHLCGIEEIHHR